MNPVDILPHQAPMRLVKAYLGLEGGEAVVLARFSPSHPLAKQGAIPIYWAAELVAQASACALAAQAKAPKNPSASGLLLSLRAWTFGQAYLPVDEDIKIYVTLPENIDGDALAVSGRVVLAGLEVARGQVLVGKG